MDLFKLILILASLVCLCSVEVSPCFAQPNAGYSTPSFAGNLPWDARQQYYEQIPRDRGFDEFESPLDRFFKQALNESWIQIDYMHWNIADVPDDLIGAPVLNVTRPDLGFTVNDTTTGAPPLDPDNTEQRSYVPRLGEIDLNNQPGIKLTYGLNTTFGALESNVFWNFKGTSSFSPGPFIFRGTTVPGNQATRFRTPIVDPNGVAVIPFNVGGLPSNQALIFDRTLSISYDSSMIGTELNFVWDDQKPTNGYHFKYVFGFRYLKLNENLTMLGTDNQVTTDINNNDVTFIKATTIESDAINQIFGPQIGAKIEFVEDQVTFGAQPMFTFAFNHLDAKVQTTNLFAADNPTTPLVDESTPASSNSANQDQFSPVLSLALYSKIRMTEAMHLYVSYDVLFLSEVSRPADNILYDQSTTVEGFGVQPSKTTMLNQGLSAGAVIEF